MIKEEIVNTALDNLQKNTGIVGIQLDYHDTHADGAVELVLKNKRTTLPIEVKKEIRVHQLVHITDLKYRLKRQVLLIAERIFPTAKEELRELDIPYLEINGNVYLKLNNNLFWVELQKPVTTKKEKNRAYTKTGLQVVFEILIHPEIINLTQREMADITHVGLGQINNVLNGLKTDRFLIQKNNNELILQRKEELFQKWVGAYDQRLRPKIAIGNFRFVEQEDFHNWDKIKFETNLTFWGGEAAGNLLTNYLYPQRFTIYTKENRQDLIKKYKIVPDVHGDIEVLRKFWHTEWDDQRTVPPELVYTDLINHNDKRCRETARMIYDKHIKDRFI